MPSTIAAVKPTTVANTVAQVWRRMLACCGVVFKSSKNVGQIVDGVLVNSGLIRPKRGSASHSTRKTPSRPSCETRTIMRSRRSRRSQSRYCGLGLKGRCGPPAVSAFDMNLELLPQRVEVAVELRRVSRRERRRLAAIGGVADHVLRLHPARPSRQHHHTLRHTDRLTDVVGHEDRGLAFAPENFGDLVGECDAGLRIKRRERL